MRITTRPTAAQQARMDAWAAEAPEGRARLAAWADASRRAQHPRGVSTPRAGLEALRDAPAARRVAMDLMTRRYLSGGTTPPQRPRAVRRVDAVRHVAGCLRPDVCGGAWCGWLAGGPVPRDPYPFTAYDIATALASLTPDSARWWVSHRERAAVARWAREDPRREPEARALFDISTAEGVSGSIALLRAPAQRWAFLRGLDAGRDGNPAPSYYASDVLTDVLHLGGASSWVAECWGLWARDGEGGEVPATPCIRSGWPWPWPHDWTREALRRVLCADAFQAREVLL